MKKTKNEIDELYIEIGGKVVLIKHESVIAEETGIKRDTLRKRRQYGILKGDLRLKGGVYYIVDNIPGT